MNVQLGEFIKIYSKTCQKKLWNPKCQTGCIICGAYCKMKKRVPCSKREKSVAESTKISTFYFIPQYFSLSLSTSLSLSFFLSWSISCRSPLLLLLQSGLGVLQLEGMSPLEAILGLLYVMEFLSPSSWFTSLCCWSTSSKAS